MLRDIEEYLIDKKWVKKPELLEYLKAKGHKVCERKLRQKISDYNEGYGYETHYYIAHSGRGYRLTYDHKIIKKALDDYKKRALKMLERYYDGLEAMGLENQVSLDLGEDDKALREIAMRGIKNG